MSLFEQCFLIIDALDECIEKESVFGFLKQASQWNLPSLHLMVFSRREKDIEDALVPLVTQKTYLSNAEVDDDIRLYVRQRLQTDPKLNKWPAHIKLEIETTLGDKASGMFRWAVCQLDAISSCMRLWPLRKALSALPKTLDKTYDPILLEIPETYYEDTLKLLQLLCFSARSVRLLEACEILAVDPYSVPHFSPEQRLHDPLDILTLCSGFVTISSSSKDSIGDTLKLAHFSVKEYLTSPRLKSGQLSRFYIGKGSANEAIAEICLLYLLSFDDPTNPLDEKKVAELPLANYASKYWPYHFFNADTGHQNGTLLRLGGELLKAESFQFLNWVRLHDPDLPYRHHDFSMEQTSLRSPLYYASFYGLTQLVDLLLERGCIPKENTDFTKWGERRTPLQAAAVRGHVDVVQQLIAAETDIEKIWIRYTLQLASQAAEIKVVKALLEYDLPLDLPMGHFGTPIQAACTSNKT
ncbi:MAG: hypothetical protein M1814_005950 [Vezdaea aestivalis]|nr:MAG: hypothetical protein M1814_005950 [Vezdaea aestivalis]